jgi:prefoldin subunit 5
MNTEQIKARIDALVAENQALGAQIDALREHRRAINAEVAKLNQAYRLAAALGPEVEVPGATVDVSGAELLAAMSAAIAKH